MPETTEQPLVTFAVIAYNQERFIREAIEGAFAQTYHPLEIILSDDRSSDRTYQIMKEMAVAYDGPHKVVLNRNNPNLGIVPHFNKILEMSSGHFVCVNAGDDFSRVDRVDTLYKNWVSHGGKHDIVHSAAQKVNEASKFLEKLCPHVRVPNTKTLTEDFASGHQIGIGATFMYKKSLFEVFGALPECARVEDRPMIFRAHLLGGLLFVNEPLLYYRTGGVSSPTSETMGQMILFGSRMKTLSWRVSSAKCYLEDLKSLSEKPPDIDEGYLNKFVRNGEWELKLSSAQSFQRLKMLPEAFIRSIESYSFKPMRSYLKYFFWPLYYLFLNTKLFLKKNITWEDSVS